MNKQDEEKENAKELAEVLYSISCNGHLSKQDLFHYLMEMAAWKDQHPRKGLWDSKKVIEWIKNNAVNYVCFDIENDVGIEVNYLINDIKEAMED